MNLRLIFSAAISATLSIAAAAAADLPMKAMLSPIPSSAWTGFYVGGTAGVGWGNEASNLSISTPTFQDFSPILPGRYKKRTFGGIGGVEAGYNYQINSLVLGVESDFSAADINGSANANETFFFPPNVLVLNCQSNIVANCLTRVSYSERQTLNWLATFRGRIGFTATPSLLFYATGGWAVGLVRSSALLNIETLTNQGGVTTSVPGIFAGSSSQIQNGWTVGGGAEYMLTRNWTGKGEYLYYDLGSAAVIGTTTVVRATSVTTTSNMTVHGQIFRVGANYKF